MLKNILTIFVLITPLIAAQDTTPSCEGVGDHTFIISPVECNIYYECINNIAYQLQCPRGLYFSTTRQDCVPYDESDCVLVTTPPPGPPTCDTVPDFWLIPSLDFCDYYYQCIDRIQYLLKCPRGLYFSFEHQTCVQPSESDCPLINTTPPPTTPPPRPQRPTCDDVDEFGMIPSIDGCNMYYMCIDVGQFLLQCPRGNYFSFAGQNCGTYDQSDCYSWDDMDQDEIKE